MYKLDLIYGISAPLILHQEGKEELFNKLLENSCLSIR